ncbi:hypothetical protein QR680_013355 [Steinernema hermaphroditum]|uniref:V-type proton ATPase subunit a n=1 Tax=Steinernema hermaphroditum TaxID=289476 RepID=A0AA39M2D4_9BILA|nr:hypothetical protein QR680_013355 [Steinernema hermaphroditum]
MLLESVGMKHQQFPSGDVVLKTSAWLVYPILCTTLIVCSCLVVFCAFCKLIIYLNKGNVEAEADLEEALHAEPEGANSLALTATANEKTIVASSPKRVASSPASASSSPERRCERPRSMAKRPEGVQDAPRGTDAAKLQGAEEAAVTITPELNMGELFRSEEMCRAQIFFQTEAAYNCVAELGESGVVQFRDLNPDVSPFQRKFVSEVRRCDEMERKLRYIEREIKKDEIPMLDTGENPDAPQPREIIDLEATFEKLENELREVNHNEEMLKKNYAELTELKHILRKTQQFFEEVEQESRRMRPGPSESAAEEQQGLLSAEYTATGAPVMKFGLIPGADSGAGTVDATKRLKFVAGVIQRERIPAFERLLWRACRGNVFLRQSEITETLSDTVTGEPVNKSVFIIFFQGDQLKSRVRKICDGFRATQYPCPDNGAERREMSIGVMTRIEDLKTVLGQTQDHRHRVLVAASKNVRMWMTKVRKVKAIYHTLNYFNLDVTQKCLIAECWCPVADLERIQMALKRGTEDSGSTVPSILHRMETSEAPPTFHRTNKYTRGFQNIVDAYGMASYREINPAPFTIITFPFIFAIMFGDCGHGLIMFLAALFLILKERKLEAQRISSEIFQMFFQGRYIVVLMGLFSIYTGFIYNDCFSKSFNLFGSAWKNTYNLTGYTNPEEMLMLVPEKAYDRAGGPYFMGVDPVWNLAETNKLSFLNSMKMKSSVIIGIVQMTFGLCLSYYNHRFFNSKLDILYMFIPQMIFLACIFMYLGLQIIAKWIFFSSVGGPDVFVLGNIYPSSNCAPSLLTGFINMFMFKSRVSGFVDKDGKELPLCHLNLWYPGQSFFESLFVLIGVACIPVMLFAKPYLMWKESKMRQGGHAGTHQQLSVRADINGDEAEVVHHDAPNPSGGGHGHGDGPFDFGEIMVHQAIHTIEFALGCVSHTASYLRLWALSLAHAQLSDVLWSMVFRRSFSFDGYLGVAAIYVLFFMFASLSLAVLVVMEGLSAFLHALRLHWVEFQSKFYVGQGYAFTPFSFEQILEEARAAEDAQ